MSLIGFTTGFLFQHLNTFSEETLNICKQSSDDTIEINCIGGMREGDYCIDDIKPEQLEPFTHVSLHAPCRNFKFRNNQETRDVLDKIHSTFQRLNKISYAVFHPDTIVDWEVFQDYDFPIAMENMDIRKSFGISVDHLKSVFDRMDCKFVLDLNHCYTFDPTMKLAKDFYDAFQNRLCEIHLSGYDGYHALLYQTKQTEILEAIPEKDVPIILESVCSNIQDVRREVEYVRNFIG